MWTRDNLLELIHTKMQDYRFILVSHREPYIHRFAAGERSSANSRPAG